MLSKGCYTLHRHREYAVWMGMQILFVLGSYQNYQNWAVNYQLTDVESGRVHKGDDSVLLMRERGGDYIL